MNSNFITAHFAFITAQLVITAHKLRHDNNNNTLIMSNKSQFDVAWARYYSFIIDIGKKYVRKYVIFWMIHFIITVRNSSTTTYLKIHRIEMSSIARQYTTIMNNQNHFTSNIFECFFRCRPYHNIKGQ